MKPTIRAALASLLEWFRDEPGALSASELLLPGCPNELRAAIEDAREAIARDEAGPRAPAEPAARVVLCRECGSRPCNDRGDLLCDECQPPGAGDSCPECGEVLAVAEACGLCGWGTGDAVPEPARCECSSLPCICRPTEWDERTPKGARS